jgi:hypothetical protein
LDKTINIVAVFQHTDLELDPILFNDPTALINVHYGDAFTNPVTNGHKGSTDVATVDSSGAVTIKKVGTTSITAEKEADPVYARAIAGYTLIVNPRPVIVTPDAGQGKAYGEADPAYTYTPSEALITGNSFSGALSRASGENVDTYAFTLGTLSAGANYALELGGSASFTIGKAGGAAVGAVTVSGATGIGAVTINTVVIPNNPGGQAVEYAISTVDGLDGAALDALAWQSGPSFSGLAVGTDYYIYARSAENANYKAGACSVSTIVRFCLLSFDANGANGTVPAARTVLQGTEVALPDKGNLAKTSYVFACWNTKSDGSGDDCPPGELFAVAADSVLYAKWTALQVFQFQFELPLDNQPVVSGITISQTGLGGYPVKAALELANQSEFDSITWHYGSEVLGTGWSLMLDASDIRYNVIGTHNITVMVWKNGVPYSRTVSFNIAL